MNSTYRSSDDFYLWFIFGTHTHSFQWGEFFAGGGQFANQWLTLTRQGFNESGQLPYLNLSSNTPHSSGDVRIEDRITFDFDGTQRAVVKNVEYIDSTLDTTTHLRTAGHFGFTTDASLDSIYANVGNHHMTFTTAIKDNSLHLGGGWDSVTLDDHFDVPGEQYWSLIRRDGNPLDAYSLLTGRRIRMEDGQESINGDPTNMNFGEVELVFLKESWNSDFNRQYIPGQDIVGGGTRATSENIDLRSDGQTHSDSFNLAYFNFIRYTSDNVWVGEATIHDGTDYSTPSDRRVATDKNVLLKSGYTYDAPVLDGQLSVIGQSRNGTHDLIVAERDPGEAINGHFRLYAFDVDSDLYNEFNQVFLGTSAGENPVNFASATVDTPANRVAMYGFGGNDILTSGAGKDYLFGGRSTFNVTNANNTAIVSSSGNVITGGTGADYFGTGATNSSGQLIDGTGIVLGTGVETGAPQGSLIGSTSTGGVDGKGVGLFWVSHATDVITDWEAGIDTLVVLENGVAIIGGVRSGATVTDLRGSNTSGADGNTTINLRATAAVATSDQDFDGARGGSDSQLPPATPDYDAGEAARNWDQVKSLDFVYDNQAIRDANSITNETNDVTVVNAGLIVARGLGGTDTLLDSPGDDYLYGNRGSNNIDISAGGNDRVYYDTFDGAQARHYVSDFTKSTGSSTDRDTFYLNKGVIDAFYSGGSTRALTTVDANGIYTDAIAYAPSINFLHDSFYNPSIVTTNAVHRGEDGQAPSVIEGSDGTTFGIGVGMFAAGTVLLFVPFMSGVGYALMASGTALGAGSSLVKTQPHQNATFAGDVGAYLNVLTEQSNSNGEGTLLKPATSVASADSGVTFLSFFEGVNAGDGYLPVVEFTSHAGEGIFGYFAMHSSTETFVYLVASRDNLVTDSEAIQIAQIEGNLTAADFAIYDGRVDIYNQAVEDPIVIVEPTIVTLGDDTIVDVLTLDPKRFDDVDNPLKLTMTVPGNVVGANIMIYDGTSIVYNGTNGTYTSAASGNNPGGDVKMTSSTYNAGTTTFEFSDERVLGTRAIKTDENELNDAVNGNQFQLADTIVNYTVAFADPTTGIETYDATGGVEVAGGNATIDGQAGDDILFVSETSSFLNNAHDNQLVSIESIAVTGGSNIDLSNQSEGFSISGSGAADTIVGGAGANYIVGGGGNDSLVGASNNDTFVGFTGTDTISAGSGTDKLVISGTSSDLNSASNAQITGIDIVEVDIAEVSPILGLIVEGGVVTGVDVVNPGAGLVDGTYNISLQPASGFGTAAVVAVTVSNGSIVIPTVAGTDKPALLTPTSGGSGYTSPASDVTISTIAFAGDGALVDLSNQSDGFQIVGDSYADTLIGSSGNDTLTGGAGADEIDGGDGNDTLRFASGDELAADTSVTGGNGSDTIEITAADLTIVDADFTNVLTLEALSLTGASSAILGTEATQGGITTVRTGSGATSVERTDTTATTVDANLLGNDTTLTIADTGVTTNFVVNNLVGNLDASTLGGTLTVDLPDNTVDEDVTIAFGTGNLVVTGSDVSDTLTISTLGNIGANTASFQVIDLSLSSARDVVNAGVGAQRIIVGGTTADLITTGSDWIDPNDGVTVNYDRVEFLDDNSLIANMSFVGGNVVANTITTITDYNDDVLDFEGTEQTAVSSDGSHVTTGAGGKVTVWKDEIPSLEAKISLIQSDNLLDVANTLATFEHDDDLYVYFAGASIGDADDQLIKLSGAGVLDTVQLGNSFTISRTPPTNSPVVGDLLLTPTGDGGSGPVFWNQTANKLYQPQDLTAGNFGTSIGTGDDFSQWVDIRAAFANGVDMYGTAYKDLYMGSNGYVTFGSGYSSFTPSGIPGFTRSPMIAASFDDLFISSGLRHVDGTAGDGTGPNEYTGNSTGSGGAYYHLEVLTDGNGVVTDRKVIFTWDNVDFYGWARNYLNPVGAGTSMQVIIHDLAPADTTSKDFGIEIRYEDIGSHDQTDPTAGWTAGDTFNYGLVNQPGQTLRDVANSSTNVDTNGVWVWSVQGGEIQVSGFIDDVDNGGTYTAAVSVYDIDAQPEWLDGGTASFSLLANDHGVFALDATTGLVTVPVGASLNLWKEAFKDGEASFIVQATATNGTQVKTADQDFVASIVDNKEDPVVRGTVDGNDADAIVDHDATSTTLTVYATSSALNNAADADLTTIDTINMSVATAGVTLDLSNQQGGGETFTITGSGYADVITGGGDVDSIIAGTGNDTINGGEGADNMDGGAGADVFVIDLAADHAAGETITGGGETDVIRFTSTAGATLTLSSNVSVEQARIADATGGAAGTTSESIDATNAQGTIALYGNDGANSLTGNASANVIVGGAGADTITGAGGDDNMDGGDGNDVFIIAAAGDHSANETITGGNETDVIGFTSTAGATLTLSSNVSVEQARIADATGGAAGTTSESIDATNAQGTIALYGNNGANSLTGNASANVIVGGAGADTITGAGGDDNMDGGDGNDVIDAGNGDDFVNAGGGDDWVTLLLDGNDTVDGGSNFDTLSLASGAYDLADLSNVTGFEYVEFVGTAGTPISFMVPNSLTLGSGDGNAIIFSVAQANTAGVLIDASAVATGFIEIDANSSGLSTTVSNMSGNDTIIGSQNSDYLAAGAGDDIFIGELGDDVFFGGAGRDTFVLGSGSIDEIKDFIATDDYINVASFTSANWILDSNGQSFDSTPTSVNATDKVVQLWATGSTSNTADVDSVSDVAAAFSSGLYAVDTNGKSIVISGRNDAAANAYVWLVDSAADGVGANVTQADVEQIGVMRNVEIDNLTSNNFIFTNNDVVEFNNNNGDQSVAGAASFGDDATYRTITDFQSSAGDKIEMIGFSFEPGRGNSTSVVSTLGSNGAIDSTSTILQITDSSYSDINLIGNFVTGLESALDLSSLADQDHMIAIFGASDIDGDVNTKQSWVALYRNEIVGDNADPYNFQIIGLVSQANSDATLDHTNFVFY